MNKNRKYKKAVKLADYYFYKNNNLKAIQNYKKALYLNKYSNENIYKNLAISLMDIWETKNALLYCEEWLKKSSWEISLMELKVIILEKLGRKKELKICNKKILDFYEEVENIEINFNSQCKNNKLLIKQWKEEYCY